MACFPKLFFSTCHSILALLVLIAPSIHLEFDILIIFYTNCRELTLKYRLNFTNHSQADLGNNILAVQFKIG